MGSRILCCIVEPSLRRKSGLISIKRLAHLPRLVIGNLAPTLLTI
jgi:hypothetical protein